MLSKATKLFGSTSRCLCQKVTLPSATYLPTLDMHQQRSYFTKSRYIPRRAMMYVPGSDEKKLLKIPSLGADCVVMDCEDGVAINRKQEARHMIQHMLGELDFGWTEPAVRVNSVSSGLAEEDIKVLLSGRRLPSAIMLPKVEEPHDIDWFASKLDSLVGNTLDEKIRLIIFIESALALINMIEICKRATKLASQLPFRLDGAVFGSDDFCADVGATRTNEATEVLYARQKFLTIAKAFKIQAIDIVHINYKDLDSLRTQCLQGAGMGFTGKQVIHPLQVPIVQESFTPSPAKIEWATELMDAFNRHQETGQGAFTFQGAMIDMPLLLQAKNIVQFKDAIDRSYPVLK